MSEKIAATSAAAAQPVSATHQPDLQFGGLTGSIFRDHKAPDAFRTIGEVAHALGIRQHVLRYWEEHFPMLRPVKRSGNRRYYRPEDVELIETIDRLVHREGYTLRGARQAIEAARRPTAHRARGGEAGPAVPPLADEGVSLLNELIAIRAKLAAALEA